MAVPDRRPTGPTGPISDGAELVARHGDVAAVRGRYRVIDVSPYQVAFERDDGTVGTTRFTVRLMLDDGTTVGLGVRPDDERDALHDQVVVAIGRLATRRPHRNRGDGPVMAEPDWMPALVAIEAIALA